MIFKGEFIFMKKLSIYKMATCAIMAALMCILGPLSIPIGPVPVTLTNFVIYLAIMLLGMKLSTISFIVYLLLGTIGLPVFSGFSGGVAKLLGPTGGYLIGFILVALVGGLFFEKSKGQPIITGIGMFLGLVIAYILGTAWFVFQMQVDVAYALTVCVWPFVPFDIIKIVIAVIIGKVIRKALRKAGLIEETY